MSPTSDVTDFAATPPRARGPLAKRLMLCGMATTIDPARLRHGQVRGRYFRENFAQAGIDLVQIVPELVTNADAAIAAAGRAGGRIELRFGAPDPDFQRDWRRELRRLRVPALLEWRHELSCTDDGEGV